MFALDFKKRILKRREAPVPSDSLLNDELKPTVSHPVLKRILASRGCDTGALISDRNLSSLIKPDSLKGIVEATKLLSDAILQNKKIVILGDFDVDGATSTVLMLNALKDFGYDHTDYVVPNRFDYGYGLSLDIIPLIEMKEPDLLVTVDNGISSIDGVNKAKEKGWQVLITDHHLPADEVPAADAIVNPNQPGCDFPSKNLAGVGVVFYIMIALRAKLNEIGWFKMQGLPLPTLSKYLDLVALGTVADVVPLDENNRLLVYFGLKRIRKGCTGYGIKALCDVAQRSLPHLTSSDLGFALGPRLNAAGRLDDMSLGIQCMLSNDPWQAKTIAIQLNELNKMRREIEGDMKQEAEAYINLLLHREKLPEGLVLYEENWHQGVVGILASRVKETFNRPVIAFAKAGEETLKGSGRSISGLHLKDVLDRIAAKYPSMIDKYGGHAMAAGLTICSTQLAGFRAAFEAEIASQVSPEMLQGYLYTDGALTADELNLNLAQLLEEAGPWGQAFPEPIFDGCFHVVHKKILAERHLKLVLAPKEKNKPVVDAIAFNLTPEQLAYNWEFVNMAYKLNINRFKGATSLQLMAEYLEPV